jgi:predicted esterase
MIVTVYRCLVLTAFCFAFVRTNAADWRADLAELIAAEPGEARDELIAAVISTAPGWREVADAIETLEFPRADEYGPVLGTTVCIDDVERPWVLYVPASYDPAAPTPLLVWLHGGISRVDIKDDPIAYAEESNELLDLDARGWLGLYPFGQADATWWDEVGMANVRNLVRTVKRRYNVDDDRIYMAGFSDGGSAAFLHAMVDPTDYAAFVALNGHMGVGSVDADLPTYAPNFYNAPVYAVTTFDDSLYPSAKMRGSIEMAVEAGGDITYRELPGEHDFMDYAESELPRIYEFLNGNPRDRFPERIVWEAAVPEFGRCRWFSVDRVLPVDAAEWHKDYNAIMVDDRKTIGFIHDDGFGGRGVKITKVLDDTVAEDIGLAEGDVLVAADGAAIEDIYDLDAWKETISRGDDITLTVDREGETLILESRFPAPQNYFLFKREVPSAKAVVAYADNRINVKGSRLGAFTVYVHPDMIDLNRNLMIAVDGETVFDAKIEPDVGYMLSNFLEDRDRKTLYVAEVKINLEQ